jgi:hypothetical protein
MLTRPITLRFAMTVLIAAAALCATDAEAARARHNRVSRPPTPAATAPAKNVPEKNRDPADVALDRRIKGICRGC